jgi:hypothetical protein
MSTRLTSDLLVGALRRRVQAEGGIATVLHRGESLSGTIVVQIVDRGENIGFFERITGLDGTVQLTPCGPQGAVQQSEIYQYIERRTRVDPDIWVVELDIADGQRFAAEVLCAA